MQIPRWMHTMSTYKRFSLRNTDDWIEHSSADDVWKFIFLLNSGKEVSKKSYCAAQKVLKYPLVDDDYLIKRHLISTIFAKSLTRANLKKNSVNLQNLSSFLAFFFAIITIMKIRLGLYLLKLTVHWCSNDQFKATEKSKDYCSNPNEANCKTIYSKMSASEVAW